MNILITGGSRGIGLDIVNKFIQNGHSVYSPTRNELDLSNPPKLKNTNFDIVINNAGINPLAHVTEVVDRDVMQVNYYAPLSIIQQCLPHMIKQGYGRIINIGSIWIDFAKNRRSAYSASKAALHSLTKSIAAEFSKYNILCNTVSPGFVKTDLTYKNNSKDDLDQIINTIPLLRLGEPKEVSDLVYFLCITNSFINGQNIIIDGGYSCVVQ